MLNTLILGTFLFVKYFVYCFSQTSHTPRLQKKAYFNFHSDIKINLEAIEITSFFMAMDSPW